MGKPDSASKSQELGVVRGPVSLHTMEPQQGRGQERGAHPWASAGPLTDIPAEPLAMALSVYQTSTHGFRPEQDVSKPYKRDGGEEVKPSTLQRCNGSVQTGPHSHCCWAEKIIRKYPLKNSFSCLIL